jgi:hypothetical protein
VFDRINMCVPKKCLLLSFVVFLLVLSSATSNALDLERGLKNYRALLAGEMNFNQLSAEHREEVLMILSIIKNQGSSDDTEDCKDARDRVSRAADDLESRSKKLMRCASADNYSDDCSTEYRRTKSAHSDYDSAVSNFRSECD